MSEDRAYEIPTVDRLIAVVNGGDDGAEISKDYHRLVETLTQYVQDYGGTQKGKITIEIDFAADAKGIDVMIAGKVKVPARPKLKERYFASERGGVLTGKDPARGSLFEGDDLGRKRRTTP